MLAFIAPGNFAAWKHGAALGGVCATELGDESVARITNDGWVEGRSSGHADGLGRIIATLLR